MGAPDAPDMADHYLGHRFTNPSDTWRGYRCERCGLEFRIWFQALIDNEPPEPCI